MPATTGARFQPSRRLTSVPPRVRMRICRTPIDAAIRVSTTPIAQA